MADELIAAVADANRLANEELPLVILPTEGVE